MASAATASQTMTESLPPPEMTLQMKLQPKISTVMAPHPPLMAKPMGKLRLDPQRALEPARKKLSTVEAQRIMAVLQECIRRTQLLTALPYILENLDNYKIVLGSDLCQMLEGHRVIIQSFEELKSSAEKLLEDERNAEDANIEEQGGYGEEGENNRRPGSNASSARTKSAQSQYSAGSASGNKSRSRQASLSRVSSQADETMRSLTMVARQMQYSCKNIMRAFGINPTAVSTILKDLDIERGEHANDMISEMMIMKDILMEKLLTTPIEESEKAQYLKEISERERYNAGIIAKLDTELQAALDDKDQEIKKKNDVIRRLQADLHQIQKFSEEHIKRTKSEAEKQEAADVKNSDGKKTKLQQEVTQLRTQMQTLTTEHRESEQSLKKKKVPTATLR